MDEATIGMDEAATPRAPTRLWNRIQSAWNSNRVQMWVNLLSLLLYMADVSSDLMLAVEYYNNGDFHWFGWTLGFMMAPPTVMSILLIFGIDLLDIELRVSKLEKCLLSFLHLAMPWKYFEIVNQLSCGKEIEDSLKLKLSKTYLYETTFESIPQLCLQIYIINSTYEQVSVLKVISMVISLLAAVKAAVTFMYYDKIRTHKEQFSLKQVILLTFCKLVELSTRVLAIGLGTSALKQWVLLPIGVHWLVMMICIAKEIPVVDYKGVIKGLLHLGTGTFSSTFPREYPTATEVNTILTGFCNMIMVIAWCGFNSRVGEGYKVLLCAFVPSSSFWLSDLLVYIH